MDFLKEIYKNSFFNIQKSIHKINYLSSLSKVFSQQKQYLQNHLPLLRSEGGNLQTDAAKLFLFGPIPAKAKKLGLLSIYKFSLLCGVCRFQLNY
jgi:hypothetical protein